MIIRRIAESKFLAPSWRSLSLFLVVAGIFFAGVFVRVFHFHDWLRFNADQSRDASVVSDVVSGKTSPPLLGPKAGGTDFRLGPAFYLFQIASARIFGDRPDVMAYPDLLSSLLAIPLLYAFLRLYFDRRTSLSLTAVFAVSFYAVKYSRFAWNPNSLPFWTILFFFLLHRLLVFGESLGFFWAVLLGVALGIGVQLHTLALIMLPIAAVSAFAFLAFVRKNKVGKIFLMVFSVAALLNVGQISSEFQTGGKNISAFFSGVGKKQEKGSGLVRNIAKDSACFVEGSVSILTSHEISDTCEVKSVGLTQDGAYFLMGTLFLIGGIFLAVRALRREEDESKRYFLVINLFFLLFCFILLVPLANEISMRFFLVILFFPFVLLGLFLELLKEKLPRYAFGGTLLVSFVLILMNLISIYRSFSEYASILRNDSTAGMDNVLLLEVERAADFIIQHAGDSKTVVLSGDSKYLFKAMKSIRFFTEKKGIDIVQKKGALDSPIFLVENTKRNRRTLAENPEISDWETIGRFTIFRLPEKR